MRDSNNNFADIYEMLSDNYDRLDRLMSELYQHVEDHPEDEMAKETLKRLGTIGLCMLHSQMEFTKTYGDPTIKDSFIMISSIKAKDLTKGLEETLGINAKK